MLRIVLVCMALLIICPGVMARFPDKPITPCLPKTAVGMQAQGIKNFVISQEPWRENYTATEYLLFSELTGEQIQWLGYAKEGEHYKEWYGQSAAYQGINLFYLGNRTPYGNTFVLSLLDANQEIVGRIEVDSYSLDNTWIVFITGLERYGMSDGTRYDYHPLTNPQGGICVFKIADADLRQALGWQ